MICDPATGLLINKANEIMSLVSNKDRYSYELLLSEIETNTPICDTVDESINFLGKQRNELKKIGAKEGFKIGRFPSCVYSMIKKMNRRKKILSQKTEIEIVKVEIKVFRV